MVSQKIMTKYRIYITDKYIVHKDKINFILYKARLWLGNSQKILIIILNMNYHKIKFL